MFNFTAVFLWTAGSFILYFVYLGEMKKKEGKN